MDIQLSVIIVNYNGKNYLKDCLLSLKKHLKTLTYEIIILDNASADNSCEYIKTNFPEVRLVPSKINHGFGKGNNEAVKHAKGKFLLLFNNDTILLNNISSLIKSIENDNKIGVIGIKMLNANQQYLPSAGNLPNVANMFQFKKLYLNGEFKKGCFFKDYYEVGWLAGSFLLLKRSTYQLINGFDEDYFMYVEDVDFCKKIEQHGLKRVFYPKYSYIHFVGFNKNKNPFLVNGYNIYIKKHFKGLNYLIMMGVLSFNALVKKIKLHF
jgi:GT2 family glycosyltransferase